jgi:Zn-dependent protease
MNNTLFDTAAIIIPMIFAIVFHEIAHGLVAKMLGDPTASERKRLSLNPFRHVDPVGTLVVPGFLWLTTHTAFGWAKPVPVDARRLGNPRRDMMLVAAAGPGMNLIMAALAALVLGLQQRVLGPPQSTGVSAFVVQNLINFVQINVFVALFNLLPIPPFDGSHIAEGLMPRQMARSYRKLRGLGFLLVIALIVVLPRLAPGLDIIDRFVFPPFKLLLSWYYGLADMVAGLHP